MTKKGLALEFLVRTFFDTSLYFTPHWLTILMKNGHWTFQMQGLSHKQAISLGKDLRSITFSEYETFELSEDIDGPKLKLCPSY